MLYQGVNILNRQDSNSSGYACQCQNLPWSFFFQKWGRIIRDIEKERQGKFVDISREWAELPANDIDLSPGETEEV